MLRQVDIAELSSQRREAVDGETLMQASGIVGDVQRRGAVAVREHAVRLKDIDPGQPLTLDRADLESALVSLSKSERALLERTAARIQAFAELQRTSIKEVQTRVLGGSAGQTIAAVQRAGCYAPAGRFPLPSSVLMTVVTARVAGVTEVWVATPRPTPITMAAAAVAGADGLLAVGGAHAIAALAFGVDGVPACDVIVGPGNRWVTAAKQIVSGRVAIDMLAGPSELLVVADGTANPECVAADLLAQAEHDPDARVVLVSTSAALLVQVNEELTRQLQDLSTAEIARQAIAQSVAVVVRTEDEIVKACDAVAPEHLQLSVQDPESLRARLNHYGALFSGVAGAEVFGDYGAGPNHVLPTGGTARYTGGLSVFTFLRIRTWLHLDDPQKAASLARDAADLARLEGLEAHARAAELRYHRER